MNCRDYQQMTSKLVDLEIKAAASGELFEHLGKCAECRGFLETITQLNVELEHSRLLSELEQPLPDEQQLTGFFFQRRRKSVLAIMQRRLSIPVPVASVIALLLVFGTITISMLVSRSQEPSTVYITTFPGIEVEARNP